jgi:hypothetical protein
MMLDHTTTRTAKFSSSHIIRLNIIIISSSSSGSDKLQLTYLVLWVCFAAQQRPALHQLGAQHCCSQLLAAAAAAVVQAALLQQRSQLPGSCLQHAPAHLQE